MMQKALVVLFTIASTTSWAQTNGPQVLTLKQAVDYSLQNHPSNQLYMNDIELANQRKVEALSGYLPQVNAAGTFDDNLKRQTTIIPAGLFPGSTEDIAVKFGNQYQTNLAVEAQQTIYDQTLLTGLKAIKPNIEAATLKKYKNDDDLIYNTASAYYRIMILREQIKLLGQNEKTFDSITGIQKLQLEKGIIKKVDYDRVKVSLNNIRSQKDLAQTNLNLSLNQLKNAMGMPLATEITIADTINPTIEFALPQSNFDINNTWDYKILDKNIVLQGNDLKRKKAAYLPTLSFYGRYGAQTFGNEFASSFNNWFAYSSIGLKLNVPIFDGLRRSSQVKQSQLSLRNLQQNMIITKSNLELQFQNYNTQIKRSYNELQNNKANLELAKEVFDNTGLQYKQGVTTLADLLNADYSYKEAQSNYLNSLINFLMAEIDLEHSKGTLKPYINQL